MSRREKGTYVVLDRRVVAYTKTHWDASSGVLTALAEQANYADPVMKVAQLMLETDLGQRAVEKCLVRLEAEGLAVRSANGWAYPRANQAANSGANEDANDHANSDANDRANHGANNGSPESPENDVQDGNGEAPKEGEGREGRTEEPPPTPQGGQGEDSDPDRSAPEAPTPRPRRAPAPPPQLPADLAAVSGMPEAWQRWLTYRVQAGIKTTESTAEEQFRKLRTLQHDGEHLPSAVARAIEFGWKSFFPDKDRQRRPAPPAAPPADAPTPSMAELLAGLPVHPQRRVS
ncbi:hypothetical protein [uncultured Deinococcus sp.]|uniref:hypothetical protein n=1 Tax=uncultured Deinococcus sp. TaxID=158789 RepID=UPI0025F9B117|nr:hypothetical protein [uncultured Deinococcus sp.]